MEYEEAVIDLMLDKIQEVKDILTKEIQLPLPDEMTVIEWNATPVGRAMGLLGDVQSLLQGEEE